MVFEQPGAGGAMNAIHGQFGPAMAVGLRGHEFRLRVGVVEQRRRRCRCRRRPRKGRRGGGNNRTGHRPRSVWRRRRSRRSTWVVVAARWARWNCCPVAPAIHS